MPNCQVSSYYKMKIAHVLLGTGSTITCNTCRTIMLKKEPWPLNIFIFFPVQPKSDTNLNVLIVKILDIKFLIRHLFIPVVTNR
jgi:hypothetical protein